jgi:hypothetical protein
MVVNVRSCENKHPVANNDVLHDTIQVISVFRDTAKVEVVKWKTVLKQGRDRIIHDTLKCDSVYTLAIKQDTLIRIDSILIEKYVQLSNDNSKVIDSLTKDKKGRRRAFKRGFYVGYGLGLGTGIAIKK